QSRSRPSRPPVASSLPSGEKATDRNGPLPVLPLKSSRGLPASTSQRTTSFAWPTTARVELSGEKARPSTHRTLPLWLKSMTARCSPFATSHKITLPSDSPQARSLLSGEKARAVTVESGSGSLSRGLQVATSHKITFFAEPAVANVLPSGDKD